MITPFLFILFLLPIAPLVLYRLKFFDNKKAAITVPAVYIFSAIIGFFINVSLSAFVFTLAVNLLYIFPIISSFKGLLNKKLIVFPFAVILAYRVFLFIDYILRRGRDIPTVILAALPPIILNTVLLIFGLKTEIPIILSEKPKNNEVTLEKPSTETISAEKMLTLLKDKLELNIITEEEYQKEREKIINSL